MGQRFQIRWGAVPTSPNKGKTVCHESNDSKMYMNKTQSIKCLYTMLLLPSLLRSQKVREKLKTIQNEVVRIILSAPMWTKVIKLDQVLNHEFAKEKELIFHTWPKGKSAKGYCSLWEVEPPSRMDQWIP